MPTEVDVYVAALVADAISIRAAHILQRPPMVIKKVVPLPGMNLA